MTEVNQFLLEESTLLWIYPQICRPQSAEHFDEVNEVLFLRSANDNNVI